MKKLKNSVGILRKIKMTAENIFKRIGRASRTTSRERMRRFESKMHIRAKEKFPMWYKYNSAHVAASLALAGWFDHSIF
jgi:hypothetical protein